jgi:hypothetical protein
MMLIWMMSMLEVSAGQSFDSRWERERCSALINLCYRRGWAGGYRGIVGFIAKMAGQNGTIAFAAHSFESCASICFPDLFSLQRCLEPLTPMF